MNSPNSICILRLSALGDVCNAVAAVQAVQRSYPNAAITWIIGKLEHSFVHDLPGIEFIVFEKSLGKAAVNALKLAMKGRQFDVLLHMQVAMRANRLATLIPAKTKIGYDWKRAKEGHAVVTNKRIPPLAKDSPRQHVLDSFMSFAMALGASEGDCYPPRWNIPVSHEDAVFASTLIPNNQKSVIICAAASKRERCWLPERYAETADYLSTKGFKVILCGGPTPLDKELAEKILEHSQSAITNLVGQTSLKQLYALLSRADFVIAPDTGPLHMANAAGTPVIGLYAHSNPDRTGPYNALAYVVGAYHQHLALQKGKTAQQAKWGQRVKGETLMHDISTRDVCDMADRLISTLA